MEDQKAEISSVQENRDDKKTPCKLSRVWERWRSILAHIQWRRWIPVICFLLIFGLVAALMAVTVSSAVCLKVRDRIISLEELGALEGEFDAVLVLGCKVYDDGTPSARLEDRVLVGVDVFASGKCKRILMSGDSEYDDYDEVGAMKHCAIAAGVSEENILLDPYGLSTYESLIRFRDEFEGKRVIIVTQKYHLYRALYVAEKLGLEAYGVHSDLRTYQKQMQMSLREILARCKDVWFGLTQPAPKW